MTTDREAASALALLVALALFIACLAMWAQILGVVTW